MKNDQVTTPVSKPLENLVAELVLLFAQTTPGPWRNDSGYRIYAPDDGDTLGESMLFETKHNNFMGADVEFISAFHAAWPDLIRGIDALRAERDDLKKQQESDHAWIDADEKTKTAQQQEIEDLTRQLTVMTQCHRNVCDDNQMRAHEYSELKAKMGGWDGEHECGTGEWYHFKHSTVESYENEIRDLKLQVQRLGKVAEAARQLYVRPSTEHLYVVTKSTAEDLFAALDALEKP